MKISDDNLNQWAGKGLIYLATPYNHPDESIRRQRFEKACVKVAAVLMGKSIFVFCPIAHTHPIACAGELPKGWDFWQEYDRRLLWCCTELWIVKMDGWEGQYRN